MLLMGFKSDWKQKLDQSSEYLNTMYCAFNQRLSVTILRVKGGFDYSGAIAEEKSVTKEVSVCNPPPMYLVKITEGAKRIHILAKSSLTHPTHRDLRSDSHKRFRTRDFAGWAYILGYGKSKKGCLNYFRNRNAHTF